MIVTSIELVNQDAPDKQWIRRYRKFSGQHRREIHGAD
jgi:hypothetical protein